MKINPAEGDVYVNYRGDKCYVRLSIHDRATLYLVKNELRAKFRATYDPDTMEWSIPKSDKRHLLEWLRQYFADAAIHGPVAGRQRGGERKRQRASPVRSSLDDEYARLHLLPSAPLPVAEAVYRHLSKCAHPDTGGSHEASVALNRDIGLIRAHHNKNP